MTLLQKLDPFRSKKYRDSFNGCTCFACGICDGTIIGAHIRPGWVGGMKPHDYWIIALCGPCHATEGANPTKFYAALGYEIEEIKDVARARFRRWSDG